ncbi:MAG: molybdenum ABC transporter ATP-binding protein [Pseudomonadota bacterium]
MSLSVRLRHPFPGLMLDVAFTAPGGVTALFGRSGAGKTSVIQAVAGLLRPREGRIALDERVFLDTKAGRALPPHRRRMGYVFQEGRLFPHLSVRRNLRYGAWFAGGAAAETFDAVVALLGLEALLDRAPGDLSGGERQRVAIGRALLARPRMLLMDEPLAALDAARKAEILPYLERLRDEAKIPILYVSHAIEEVARLASTIVVLEAGRVAQAGPAAALLADPAAVPLLGVRDAGAVVTAIVRAHAPDGLSELALGSERLVLPGVSAMPGTPLRLRIPAQDVILATARPEGLSALNVLPATILGLQSGTGPGVMVQLQLGDTQILARVTRRSADALQLAPGRSCYAILKSVAIAPVDIGGIVPPR